MIGKHKFVAILEGQPDTIVWEKDIETARTAMEAKFGTVREILPNKEYLKKVKKQEKKTAKEVPVQAVEEPVAEL